MIAPGLLTMIATFLIVSFLMIFLAARKLFLRKNMFVFWIVCLYSSMSQLSFSSLVGNRLYLHSRQQIIFFCNLFNIVFDEFFQHTYSLVGLVKLAMEACVNLINIWV